MALPGHLDDGAGEGEEGPRIPLLGTYRDDVSPCLADFASEGNFDEDKPSGSEPQLGWFLTASYGSGHVLNDLSASMWFFYAVIYLQEVLALSEKTTGGIVLIGQVVDALTTPLVGYASDHTTTVFGSRKPWHLFGVISVALTFPLVFGGCLGNLCVLNPWHDTGRSHGLLIAFISLFQIGWASTQVSHLALMSDITSTRKQRTTLSAVRYGVTVTCNICSLIALSVGLSYGKSSGEESEGPLRSGLSRDDQSTFQILSWSITLIGTLSAVLFYFGIPNHPKKHSQQSQDAVVKWNFFEDPRFWKHGVLYMLSRLMINLNMVYMPLYVQSTMGMPKRCLATLPLLMYIASLFSTGCQNYTNKKLGRTSAYALGAGAQVCGSLGLFFLPRSASGAMYLIVPVIGMAGTCMLVNVISMTSDMLHDQCSVSAKVFGLYSFTDKLCSGIAIAVIQASISRGGICYRKILGLVPLGAAVLSLALCICTRASHPLFAGLRSTQEL